MAMDYEAVDRYIDAHLEDYVTELAALCALPSVSAQGTAIDETVALVRAMLAERGFATEVLPTAGYPVVYARAAGSGPGTMLLYNHYDVQPPEPLDLWDSPPFELTRRDGRLIARGVADDKGHIVARLAALDALKAVTGSYPCEIKFLIEGEEEIGSVNLAPFIAAETERLKADGCIWEFGGVNHLGQPLIVLGMRGIMYVELSVRTANRDAHSGLVGSLLENAAWRLVWALSSLKGQDERILIPGFYDDVLPPTARDLAMLAEQASEAEDIKQRYAVSRFLNGVTDENELKRMAVFEPTCTICGLTSGYQGPGSKTVLPATASAKIDFRLVPTQDPDDIVAKLRAHLDAHGFDDIEITKLGGEAAGRTSPDEPLAAIAIETGEAVYGVAPAVYPIIGGSGPNHAFIEHLNVPIVTAGIVRPDSQAHAPNEQIHLVEFVRGAQHTARIIGEFAARYAAS